MANIWCPNCAQESPVIEFKKGEYWCGDCGDFHDGIECPKCEGIFRCAESPPENMTKIERDHYFKIGG